MTSIPARDEHLGEAVLLLVEDNPDDVMLVRQRCASWGYRCVSWC